jgi:hypothetical protein
MRDAGCRLIGDRWQAVNGYWLVIRGSTNANRPADFGTGWSSNAERADNQGSYRSLFRSATTEAHDACSKKTAKSPPQDYGSPADGVHSLTFCNNQYVSHVA